MSSVSTYPDNHLEFQWVQIRSSYDTKEGEGLVLSEGTTFYFKQTNTPNSVNDYTDYSMRNGENSYPAWFKYRFRHLDSSWTVSGIKAWLYTESGFSNMGIYARSHFPYDYAVPVNTETGNDYAGSSYMPSYSQSIGNPVSYVSVMGTSGSSGDWEESGNLCCQFHVEHNFNNTTNLSESGAAIMIQYDESF